MLTSLVVSIYIYLTITTLKQQHINEGLPAVRSSNADLMPTELERKHVLEGDSVIISEKHQTQLHFPWQGQQGSPMERPSDIKLSAVSNVKLQSLGDQPNRLNEKFPKLTVSTSLNSGPSVPHQTEVDTPLVDALNQAISNTSKSYTALHQLEKQRNTLFHEPLSIPPSFQNIADFPSEKKPGDIPVVSRFDFASIFISNS